MEPLRDTGDWSKSLGMIGQFFYILLILAAVAALAYLCTKWLASARLAGRGRKNIQVLESCALGAQSAVQLVRIGGKYVLLGVTKEQITFLAEIDAAQISALEKKPAVTDSSA